MEPARNEDDFVNELKRACINYDQTIDLLNRCYKKGYSNELIENMHLTLKNMDFKINNIIYNEDQKIIQARQSALNLLNSILNPQPLLFPTMAPLMPTFPQELLAQLMNTMAPALAPLAPLVPALPQEPIVPEAPALPTVNDIIDGINAKTKYTFNYTRFGEEVIICFTKVFPTKIHDDMNRILAYKLDQQIDPRSYSRNDIYTVEKKITIHELQRIQYNSIRGSFELFEDRDIENIKQAGITRIRFNFFMNCYTWLTYECNDKNRSFVRYNLKYMFNPKSITNTKYNILRCLDRFSLTKVNINSEDMSITVQL